MHIRSGLKTFYKSSGKSYRLLGLTAVSLVLLCLFVSPLSVPAEAPEVDAENIQRVQRLFRRPSNDPVLALKHPIYQIPPISNPSPEVTKTKAVRTKLDRVTKFIITQLQVKPEFYHTTRVKVGQVMTNRPISRT